MAFDKHAGRDLHIELFRVRLQTANEFLFEGHIISLAVPGLRDKQPEKLIVRRGTHQRYVLSVIVQEGEQVDERLPLEPHLEIIRVQRVEHGGLKVLHGEELGLHVVRLLHVLEDLDELISALLSYLSVEVAPPLLSFIQIPVRIGEV